MKQLLCAINNKNECYQPKNECCDFNNQYQPTKNCTIERGCCKDNNICPPLKNLVENRCCEVKNRCCPIETRCCSPKIDCCSVQNDCCENKKCVEKVVINACPPKSCQVENCNENCTEPCTEKTVSNCSCCNNNENICSYVDQMASQTCGAYNIHTNEQNNEFIGCCENSCQNNYQESYCCSNIYSGEQINSNSCELTSCDYTFSSDNFNNIHTDQKCQSDNQNCLEYNNIYLPDQFQFTNETNCFTDKINAIDLTNQLPNPDIHMYDTDKQLNSVNCCSNIDGININPDLSGLILNSDTIVF